MNTRRKIEHGWQKKTSNDHSNPFPRVDLNEQPVKDHMPEKYQEIEKKAIGIIIPSGENIKKGNKLDHQVVRQVAPVAIVRIEQPGIAFSIGRSEYIGKKIQGMAAQ